MGSSRGQCVGYRRELNRIGAEAWFVLAGWFVFQFAFSGLWFTLFNLYLVRLGYTARFIGSLHGTASFAFALMSVPAGLLGARLGSRKMMIAGLCITAVFRILFLVLTGPANPGDFSALWPMTTYMAAALGSSIYMVNSVPALSAATDITTRGLVFSVSTAATGLGTFTGSLVGGIIPSAVSRLSRVGLSDPAPYRAALFLVPLLMIVSAGLVTLVRERTAEQSSATKAPASARTRPWGLIIGVSAIWFLLRASLGPVFYFFLLTKV